MDASELETDSDSAMKGESMQAFETEGSMTGEELATLLDEEIITGFRFPGERLVEDQLIEQFGAKRYAVRKALALLQQGGLIDRRRNAGAFVRSYSEKQVRDLFDLRVVLERACAQSTRVPVSADEMQRLKAGQREHDEAVNAGDIRGAVVANVEFHQRLFGLSSNQELVRAVNYYARMSYVMRSVGFSSKESLERSRREHWGMIRALGEGDTEKLADLCHSHLEPSRDAYLDFVRRRL